MFIDELGVVHGPLVRSAFNYDADAVSLKTALYCGDGTRAQQQFRDECDINTIVRNFGVTGELPQGVRIPFQADFSEGTYDYRTSLDMLRAADEAFMAYPAEIRARFQNDPERFVAFVSDPANIKQVKEWGLGRAETPLPEPMRVQVIPNPPDPTKTAPEAV